MKDYGATTTSGSNFADNRGRMPFPVRGQITHRFGASLTQYSKIFRKKTPELRSLYLRVQLQNLYSRVLFLKYYMLVVPKL